MSILTKVWGGPFKAPPMVQPVSIGWVFLKILETLWRLLIVLVVIVALFAAGLWVSEGNPLSSQVKVQLGTQGSCADKKYPLDVALTNESKKTLGEIDLKFRVYQRGKSEDVATYMSSTPELHDILGPGRTIYYCFRMPAVEPGSTGPYTLAVDVTYASELSKDVPAAAGPPPMVRSETPATKSAMPRPWWGKVSTYVVVAVSLVFFGIGGFGLVKLIDRVFKTAVMARVNPEGNEGGCLGIFFFGLVNALLVSLASTGLSTVGLSRWIDDLDAWSRSAGLADGAVMIASAIACQWPWLVLLALPIRGAGEEPRQAA